jgi:hypothetical protein
LRGRKESGSEDDRGRRERASEEKDGEEGEREVVRSRMERKAIRHLITSLLFPVILSSTSLPLSFFRLHPPY